MAQTVFSAWAGVDSNVTSTGQSSDFYLPITSGEQVPSNAIISSAILEFTSTYQFSALRLYAAYIDDMQAHAAKSTSGNSASSNYAEPLRADLYNTNFYSGKSGVTVKLKGHGKGSASNDGNVLKINKTSNVILIVNWVVRTAAGAPTSVSASPSVAEKDPTLSWSGAKAGTSNTITGYELQYCESANGSSWGSWQAIKTVASTATSGSTTVPVSPTRGYYRKYRVRTQGSAGSSYYSAWKESGVVRRNSAPTAPKTVSVTPTAYEGGNLTISISGATDPDSNIAKYTIERNIKSGTSWAGWAALKKDAGSTYTDNPNIDRGQEVQYRAKSVDAFGIESGWANSNIVKRNEPPSAPVINRPGANEQTHNIRPRLLITIGSEPNGQMQTLIADGYTPSTAGSYVAGKKLILRKAANAAVGNNSISISTKDPLGAASSVVSLTYVYGKPVWTDAPLTAKRTRVKAVHLNEIRDAVNVVRAYYGLPAYNWEEDIIPRRTSYNKWPVHIAEIWSAIDAVVTYVNSWDSTATSNKITLPAKVKIKSRPSADVINQLRDVIALL